jgi:hypothetical protein
VSILLPKLNFARFSTEQSTDETPTETISQWSQKPARNTNFHIPNTGIDRFCGLVVRVPSYRSRGLDSIPGSGSGYNWGATWKKK